MKRNASNICPVCDAGDPTSVITECDCVVPARAGKRYVEVWDSVEWCWRKQWIAA